MIRVLFVITRMAVGGVPQHVLTVIQKMDRSRYHITLATGLPGPEEGSLMAEACALGVEMYVLPDLKREVHLVHDVRAFYELYRIVRSGRYDIVHTHLSKAGILGRMAAWCAGVNRIVHTCHGDVFERYFGRLKSAMLLGVERLVGRATGRFVSVSRALKKQFQMYRIGRPNLFTVVHNGIDTRPFEGVRRRVGEGECAAPEYAMPTSCAGMGPTLWKEGCTLRTAQSSSFTHDFDTASS